MMVLTPESSFEHGDVTLCIKCGKAMMLLGETWAHFVQPVNGHEGAVNDD